MIDKRKAEVAAYAVAAFVVVLLAMRLLHHNAEAGTGAKLSLEQPGKAGARAGSPGNASTPHARALVVDVAGEVRKPGVYRLPAGSRADAAVQRAGGVTRHGESTAVNLAMPLHDGQQVVVPKKGASAPAGAVTPDPGSSVAGDAPPQQPISLSTATVAELDTLDGIGPTLAGRIIQYRDSHGGFRSIQELRQVDGIGDKRFAALSKAVQP